MPISETGHARNVEHFQSLISFVTGYAAAYSPSNTALALTALNDILSNSQDAIDGVSSQLGESKSVINDRENAFEPLKKLGTRVVNYYASTGAEKNAIEDAKGFKRKLDGRRLKTVIPDDPNTPEDESAVNISASQQSYTQLIEHFDNLIEFLGNDALYDPNETDLKMLALNTFSTTLKAKNTAVINTFTALSNARIARNAVLYNDDTSLVNTALLVKQYVKSLFGASSPQYKQVSGLEFKRPGKG
jgi:hypothetical protein